MPQQVIYMEAGFGERGLFVVTMDAAEGFEDPGFDLRRALR